MKPAKTKLVEKRCDHCRGVGSYTLQGRDSITFRQCSKCQGRGRRNYRVPVVDLAEVVR